MNLIEDEKYVSFKKAFDNGEFSLDTDKYIEEVKNIHITRNIRSLRSENIINDLNKVIDSILQNQSNRSRIVEIKMICTSIQTKVAFRKESLSNYLLIKYKAELRENFKTQVERKSFIEDLFSFTNISDSKLKTLQSFCDLIIQDIDNASWALKAVIDCLKISDIANKLIV